MSLLRCVCALLLSLLFGGVYAQPAAEEMFDEPTIARIAAAADVAGQGSACGLNWQPYYLTFMRVERQKSWTQIQLAFMGAYFGMVQEVDRERWSPCSAFQRTQAQTRLDEGIAALRAQLSPGTRYYPADKFVFEPRIQLPEGSLEATRPICNQILAYKFEVPPHTNPYRCYTLQSTPEEVMTFFRSQLVIMGYKMIEEGEEGAMFSAWQRYGSPRTLLLTAVASENGTYLVALDASPPRTL